MLHTETLVPSLGSLWYGKIKHGYTYLHSIKKFGKRTSKPSLVSWTGKNWFYKWTHLMRLILKEMVAFFRSSLCFMPISGRSNSLKEKQCFQLKPFFACPLFLPLWASWLYLERWYVGKPLLFKFLTSHTQCLWQMKFMADLTWWLWVCLYCRHLCSVRHSFALALVYLFLLTTVKACNRASRLLRACCPVWEYYSCCHMSHCWSLC